MIDIHIQSEDMFSQGVRVEVLIEAQDAKGNVIGEPRPGADVNAATRTLTLMPRQTKQVALRMGPDFEGKFSVKRLTPPRSLPSAFSHSKRITRYDRA